MFEAHNEERAKPEADAEPLLLDGRLVLLARRRAQDMADRDYFGHIQPDGETAFTLLAELDIPYDGAGENIVANDERDPRRSVNRAMRDLMLSPGHRNNILRERWKRVGIGAVYDEEDEKWYYCAIFVSP